MIYILKLRAQHLLVWNNAPPHIRKSLRNRRLSPTDISGQSFYSRTALGGGVTFQGRSNLKQHRATTILSPSLPPSAHCADPIDWHHT